MNEPRTLVLIGAARSGTKIMRDSLAAALDIGAVPYDVGFVWRYGNESTAHDVLRPADVRPKTRRLVHSYLARYVRNGAVIEKTVGNTLRVPFVAELLPDARFVYVERDGVDVAVSTQREWLADSDLSYLKEKAKHFPLRLVPTYGLKFLRTQTLGRRNASRHVGSWGPRYPGIDADLKAVGLLRVCARQWRESVRAARAALADIEGVVRVRYEDLVADPTAELTRICRELGFAPDAEQIAVGAHMIDPARSRPARGTLSQKDQADLDEEIGPLLKELGYDAP